MHLLPLLLLLPRALAAPTTTPSSSPTSTIKLRTSTYQGFTSSNVEQWLGLPYARAPVKARRFRAPQGLASPTITVLVAAKAFKPRCFQAGSTVSKERGEE